MSDTSTEKTGHGMHWRMFVAAIMLVMGGQGFVFNSIGNYMTPLMYVTGQGSGVIGGAVSVGAIFMMIELGFVGKILKKAKLKPLLIICALVAFGAFIAMGYVTSVTAVFILFVLMDLGAAIPIFVTAPMVITNWFEKKRGTLMGITMMCGSIGAIIGSLVAGALLGPEPYNTHLAFTVIGSIGLALVLIAAFMIVPHPAMVGLKPYGAEDSDAEVKTEGEQVDPATLPGITSKEALKSLAFYCLFFIVFALVCTGSFSTLMSNFVNINFGYTNAQGSQMLALFNVGAAIGCFAWGALDDRIGVIATTVIAICLDIIGLCGLCFLGGGGFAMLAIFAVVFGLGCSATGVQQPMITSKFFGQKEYAGIFAKVQMAQTIGGMIAVVSIGAIAQATGSYTPAILLLVALLVISVLFLFVAKKSAHSLWIKSGQEPDF